MNSMRILKQMQTSTGLVTASGKDVKTGYNLAWIRDNVYAGLGFEAAGNRKKLQKIYRALIDILLKHEWKIDYAVKEKPQYAYQYIHARYDPITMNEIWTEWGNKQNDAVGALLFKIGSLEKKGIRIIRDENDLRILQKVVEYLKSIEYWQDKDNGMWEENEELHASSIGACVAGLKAIAGIVSVDKWLIEKGEAALKALLPRESETKDVDLALLSLIYPYDVVGEETKQLILKNVEKKLLRNKGVIRYAGDKYYSNGKEAQWAMGFPWLAIIYRQLNRPDKYSYYMRKAYDAMNKDGEMPELYYAGTWQHNENTPLAWAQALVIVANAA